MTILHRAISTARRYPLPVLALFGLTAGLLARFLFGSLLTSQGIFLATLVGAGGPLMIRTAGGVLKGNFAADLVASLAIIGAAVTGEYLAGCIIVLMQTGGEALEDYGVRRASASLEELLARAPQIAHCRRNGTVEDVPITTVLSGDLLVIRPGELVPVDAVVLQGVSAVDESALTGEPIPVVAQPGRELMSGSVCLDGAVEVRALRPSSDSQYQQIVRLVQDAQARKAPIARLADRYAIFFTPLTLAMCAVAYVATRRPEAVVAVLVVATPCPLILATPIAVMAGINRAARRGIIAKSGAAIELIGQVKAMVFDKTGTLTSGVPVVERVVPLDGYGMHALLRLAAGLEQQSNHPMARALVAAGRDSSGGNLPQPGQSVEAAGQGVSGEVEGHSVAVGSTAFALERGIGTPLELEEARSQAGSSGKPVSFIGIDGRLVGVVSFADLVRPEAQTLLHRLETYGIRETAMLTGDDEVTARAIATQAGIGSVKAELLPGQKVEAVRELLWHDGSVAMVGDGINDAPALAASTVGVALGAHGAAISAEAADIVITTDDVSRVADAVEIGQRTLHIAKQSIVVGLGVSGAMMVVAAFGFIPPAIGALLQEGLDVAVILNALRAR